MMIHSMKDNLEIIMEHIFGKRAPIKEPTRVTPTKPTQMPPISAAAEDGTEL